jgi:hypothetical protein
MNFIVLTSQCDKTKIDFIRSGLVVEKRPKEEIPPSIETPSTTAKDLKLK